MNIGQMIIWCNSCHFDISMLAQLNDYIGGLLHLGPNVITFRALLHLGPNVITFRTVITFKHPLPHLVREPLFLCSKQTVIHYSSQIEKACRKAIKIIALKKSLIRKGC